MNLLFITGISVFMVGTTISLISIALRLNKLEDKFLEKGHDDQKT